MRGVAWETIDSEVPASEREIHEAMLAMDVCQINGKIWIPSLGCVAAGTDDFLSLSLIRSSRATLFFFLYHQCGLLMCIYEQVGIGSSAMHLSSSCTMRSSTP